jgi:hydrogenase expression/formation protein HypE
MNISLAQGGGGKEYDDFVSGIRSKLKFTGAWQNSMDDGATLDLKNFLRGRTPIEGSDPSNSQHLVFTTDAFVVDPLFFNGGDIGKIAFCGTVNDLVMMGAVPLGLSLSFIIEEGLSHEIIEKIINSINQISEQEQIAIATGDTKVMGRGQVDKITITTSGVGITDKIITDNDIAVGDKIIISGGLGEHGTVLLANRFEYETELISDCQPLVKEMNTIKHLVKSAKDITRGGMAAIFNEMAKKAKVQFAINEEKIPVKQEVVSLSKILGISYYTLASEGRFVVIVSKENADEVERILKKFNPEASIIGEVVAGNGVLLISQTGQRILEAPTGKLVPRIC